MAFSFRPLGSGTSPDTLEQRELNSGLGRKESGRGAGLVSWARGLADVGVRAMRRRARGSWVSCMVEAVRDEGCLGFW